MSAKEKWSILKEILIETLDKSPYHPRPPWWPLCQTLRWDVLLCWPPWMRQNHVNVWRQSIHGSRTGIQQCNLQVSSLKTTSSTSKAITFCSILLSWDVVGYAFSKTGSYFINFGIFLGIEYLSQTIAAFAEDILLRGITGRYTERNHQEMLITTTSTLT